MTLKTGMPTKYRRNYNLRVRLGERYPAFIRFRCKDGETKDPLDVSGHQFAASARKGDSVIEMTPVMDEASEGWVTIPLDTTGGELGEYRWDCVWVRGPSPETDPIDIHIGGTILFQHAVTPIPGLPEPEPEEEPEP